MSPLTVPVNDVPKLIEFVLEVGHEDAPAAKVQEDDPFSQQCFVLVAVSPQAVVVTLVANHLKETAVLDANGMLA
jgi:hypothetical protein